MATWQAAEPGTVVGDAQGNYQIRIGGQWTPMPKGSLIADDHGAYHFDSDALKPAAAPKATSPASDGGSLLDKANSAVQPIVDAGTGVRDIVSNQLMNIPHLAAHGLYNILSGGKEDPSVISSGILGPHAMGPQGQHLLQQISSLIPANNPNNINSQIDAERQRVIGSASPTVQNVAEHTQRVLGDVGDILPAAGVVKGAVGAAGDLADAASAAQLPAKSPAVAKYGLVTGGEHPIARNVAGTSARPTATAANQSIADPVLGAQVGIPQGQELSAGNFETGRGPANSVYGRLEQSLPTGPLSPKAADMVNGIGSEDLVTHSPDTVSQIEMQKARLTSGPITGPQAVNTSKSLRFNGFGNIASEDPEKVALGRAQLKMADALHQHMLDTLPADADVSVEQLEGARRALAQSYTLQPFVKGGNIDLQKLAKFGRDNPGLLTGPMADFADFADKHPEVSTLPSADERFNPSGILKDVTKANVLNQPVGAVAQLFGGHTARKFLAGGKPPTIPVTGLAGEFGPIDRPGPQPPPGMTASPPTAPAPPAAGPPGQIPLADVLSHGVEQSPPAGLSLAPDPTPQGGVPFARNAAHEAGDLSLDESFHPRPSENHADVAGVRSQGVPKGTVAKTGPTPAPQPAEGGGLVFKSPNGQTIVRKRGDTLQVSASATKQTSQGRGEGTQRMVDAYNFAQAHGLRLVSDTKVSDAAAKIYDRLEKMGFDITRNPVEPDGAGNLLSTAGRPAFEITGGPLHASFGPAQ